MALIFHRLAAQELVEAHAWYEVRSRIAADGFLTAVSAALEEIQSHPHSWPIFRGPFRWIKTQRYPYLLCYEVLDDGDIRIMAVAHARRRPGYWMYRGRRP